MDNSRQDPQPVSLDETVPGEGPIEAQIVEPVDVRDVPARPRRLRLPLILFALTCLSTFWVGAMGWQPLEIVMVPPTSLGNDFLDWFMPARRSFLAHWQDGLIYSACLLGILFFHEMGHFLATVRYRIPASYPYFIPIPITPIGTMGAVIGMDGMRADRKEMFDIGIAGPLAGLIVAIPVTWIGIQQLDLQGPEGSVRFHVPLAVSWIMQSVRPEGYHGQDYVGVAQMNPYFMAGWVGLLITGLNMLPVSQLDGGHVTYTLFGKGAHWIARGFMVLVIAFVVYSSVTVWILMIIIVLMMGTDHPPTYNDSAPIGWFRYALGTISMAIPILCFPPKAITVL